MSDVSVRGVCKSFGGTRVLSGVDLSVPSGTVGVLLGPSGCGKTTLLRILAGHLQPDAGEVRIGGRLVADAATFVPPERRGISIVPQDGALFPHLDVAGNVAFGLDRGRRQLPWKRTRHEARVDELLELVGLPGAGRLHPAQLSGGQQQRVALARALAPSPALVLLDEPFSALDASLRASVRDDVKRVLQDAGATALLVTHDQEEALSMADSVAVMSAGRIEMHDTPSAVYARPATEGVARFVGEVVELPIDAAGNTPLGPVPTGCSVMAREGRVLLRPEHLVLSTQASESHAMHAGHAAHAGHEDPSVSVVTATSTGGAAADSADGAWAVVETVRYYGHDCLVTLFLDPIGQGALAQGGGTALLVRTTTPPPIGARVHVRMAGPLCCTADTAPVPVPGQPA